MSVKPGQWFHISAQSFDEWSTNEDRVERYGAECRHLDIGLETLTLAAEGIALHRDVHASDGRLIDARSFDLVGQEDHTRTCAVYREAVPNEPLKRFE